MRIKSAVGTWHKIVFLIVVAVLSASALIVPEEGLLIILILELPVAGFLLWIYVATYYEFREEYLYCRSGPFAERIPFDNIKSAVLCRNFLSSFALSTKRIEIRQHGKGYIRGTTMISPINREVILTQLLARCKNLNQK
ncbi:MAG: PH domain-containing protein [Christensenellales bacterium]